MNTQKPPGKPLILPVILIAALIIAAVIIKTRPGIEHRDEGLPARAVEIIHAATIPTRIQATGYGTIQPAVDLIARAEVSGRITYIHPQLKKGDGLPQDTVAIRIEAVDYQLSLSEREAGLRSSRSVLEQLEVEEKSVQRSLQLARENLAVGEAELKRKQEIYEKRLIARTEVDAEEQKVLDLRQRAESLQGQLEAFASRKASSRAQIEQSQAQVEEGQETLERTEIRLPFDARIGDVSIEKDEFINTGTELFRASNVDGVEVTAQIPIRHIRPLAVSLTDSRYEQPPGPIDQRLLLQRLNLQARVRLVGDDLEDAVWEGRVVRFSESIDPTRRTAGVVVAVDNPYQKIIPGKRPPLLKGMYVAVELLTPEAPMQVIPRHAIHQGNVYVVDKRGQLAIKPVKPALIQNEFAVIAEGLEENEPVIITDLIPVIQGMPLKPIHNELAQQTITSGAAGR